MSFNQIVRYNVIYDRKKEAKVKGKGLVQIAAYHGGRYRYFSTGIYLFPNDWNNNKNEPKDHFLKGQIRNQISNLESFERDQRLQNGYSFVLNDFDTLLNKKVEPVKPVPTFNEFLKNQINARSKELRWNTYKQQITCLKLLNQFNPTIKFTDLNFALVDSLHQFMVNKGHCNSTSQKRHKIFKSYLNKALKLELITRNPYDQFIIPTPIVNKIALTFNEIKQLQNVNLDAQPKRLSKVRDMFLFSVYTGLRWGDIVSLTGQNLIENDTSLILNIKAEKTNKVLELDLKLMFNGKAEVIARKYLPEDQNIKLFKGIYNAFANKSIKIIAELAGIKKSLTYHVSRHTAATLISQKAGVLVAQQILQHGKLATTQQYLHLSNQERDQALTNVSNWN
mgnify:CR=1 FL=1